MPIEHKSDMEIAMLLGREDWKRSSVEPEPRNLVGILLVLMVLCTGTWMRAYQLWTLANTPAPERTHKIEYLIDSYTTGTFVSEIIHFGDSLVFWKQIDGQLVSYEFDGKSR